MRARLAAVLTIAGISIVLGGCEPEEPAPVITESRIDLTTCLGAIDDVVNSDAGNGAVPSTCRDELDQSVATGLVNACFLVREKRPDALPQKVPYHWEAGRLSQAFPDRAVAIPPGRSLEAALFFLRESDETGDLCETLELDTDCRADARCALKLIEDEVTPSAAGNTRITFTRENGQCEAQTGTEFAGGGVETCDGMDNDCDSLVDEAVPGTGEACVLGIGACADEGRTICDADQGMVVCNATPGNPAPDEDCPLGDETCCDAIDDDCDGTTDELIDCTPCTVDGDCEGNIGGGQCVNDRCEACDPTDHGGCEATELCCGAGADAFECQPTSFGPASDEQCGACGEPCVVIRDGRPIQNADACTDRSCGCGFGTACGEPAPFCVGGDCLECLTNTDCGPQELCCAGQCQPTSPEGQCTECAQPCDLNIGNRCVDRECLCGTNPQCLGERATCVPTPTCADDPDSPSCDPRQSQCEECETDFDCPDRDLPACVNRQCRECGDDEDIYCRNAPAASREGRTQCVGTACVECDPRVLEGTPDAIAEYGCDEADAGPICAAGDNTCRACQNDAECSVRPGDRNQCVAGRCTICDPLDYAGCGDPAAPVCDDATFDCRPCGNTPECEVISQDGVPKQCVGGQCTGCDPDDNAGCPPLSAAPICNPDTLVCRACRDDAECPSQPGSNEDPDGAGPLAPASERDYCFQTQCRQCRPADHAGCDERGARPICGAGDCVPCALDADCLGRPGNLDECIAAGASAGQCKLCDPTDNAGCDDPQNPICRPDFTCGPCQDDPQCNRARNPALPPIECVDGICAECDPRPGQQNIGCDALGDLPFCDAEDAFCRRCASPAECVQLDAARGLDLDLFGCVNGGCTQCDPVTHAGCPNTQFCDGTGRCRACTVGGVGNAEGDAQCTGRGDGREQCVAGQCHLCDPADFAGCDPRGAAPACNAQTRTCEGCDADLDCRADAGHPANPVGPECVAGACRLCDPTAGQRSAGCVPASAAPFCDPGQFTCVACGTGTVGNDTRCVDNRANLAQCIGDRCAECDPRNHDGCGEAGAEPICDLDLAECRICRVSSECFARPGNLDQCVNGTCKLCVPGTTTGCTNPAAPICNGEGTACRACTDGAAGDLECPGALLCAAGRCRECKPGPANEGCNPAGPLPFCDPATFLCASCQTGGQPNDARCLDATRPQCDEGTCKECDPATQDGCIEAGPEPFCGADGNCRACNNNAECVLRPGSLDFCSAGICVQCNRDTDAGCPGDQPVCDNASQSCRRCLNTGECTGGKECVDGTCVGCDPLTDAGCLRDSTAPICDVSLICRRCQNDADCAGNPSGTQCIASGACTQCDPDAQTGCDVVGSALPFCANNGTCRACANDAECISAPGNRDQCVTSRCELCDPTGHAGCVASSNTPICAGAEGARVCRACANDGECVGNPNGGQCVAGACKPCDTVGNAGCDANGDEPICNALTLTCVACTLDGQCAGNANGTQCVSGACERCDPADTTNAGGCIENSATPICNPSTKVCVACANNAQCDLRDGTLNVCVAPRCQLCNADTDLGCGGTTPVCNNGTACIGCRNAADCGPGVQCLPDGSCAGCNPNNNAGCNRDNPICDDANRACRPCRDDSECPGGFCFEGRCEACDPEGHTGCPADQLCCQGGAAAPYACAGTSPATQCAGCGVACDADNDPATAGSNACIGRTCRCGAGIECNGLQDRCLGVSPAGICSQCRNDVDCVALSTSPICGDDLAGIDSNTCRACQSDAECAGHIRGGQCILTVGNAQAGACRVCDPAGHAGCNVNGNQPICDANNYTCRACNVDADCAGNPNGGQCVAGACKECDGARDGCVIGSTEPVCVAGNVCGCVDDASCAGNPNGTQCVAVAGGNICAQCDPAQVNVGQAGGCDLASALPYCDPANRVCVGCAANNNRCTSNPNGPVCDANRCVECLTANHNGCNADELCCTNAGRADCTPVDFNRCTSCVGGACDVELADQCDDRGCVCGNTGAPCAIGNVCAAGVCVECADDGDCGGAEPQCVNGSCEACDPINNDACNPASNTPICRAPAGGGPLACRGCQTSPQCEADPDLGDFCNAGSCLVCNPADHTTCDIGGVNAGRLCCVAGGVAQCVDGDDARCTSCLAGGACADGTSCLNRACVPD